MARGNRSREGGVGLRTVGPVGSNEPVTRAEGRSSELEIDPDTGIAYVGAQTRSGRVVEKNRSDGWRGYKSHLTRRQRRLIAYALRQRDRGCKRQDVVDKILESGQWVPGQMQYPNLTANTVGMWEMIRRSQEVRGKEWP